MALPTLILGLFGACVGIAFDREEKNGRPVALVEANTPIGRNSSLSLLESSRSCNEQLLSTNHYVECSEYDARGLPDPLSCLDFMQVNLNSDGTPEEGHEWDTTCAISTVAESCTEGHHIEAKLSVKHKLTHLQWIQPNDLEISPTKISITFLDKKHVGAYSEGEKARLTQVFNMKKESGLQLLNLSPPMVADRLVITVVATESTEKVARKSATGQQISKYIGFKACHGPPGGVTEEDVQTEATADAISVATADQNAQVQQGTTGTNAEKVNNNENEDSVSDNETGGGSSEDSSKDSDSNNMLALAITIPIVVLIFLVTAYYLTKSGGSGALCACCGESGASMFKELKKLVPDEQEETYRNLLLLLDRDPIAFSPVLSFIS